MFTKRQSGELGVYWVLYPSGNCCGLTIRPAQHATQTIPIVMAIVTDPVGSGLVASLARPGGNLTGLSIGAAELGGKRLELLLQAVPQAARVAVLWNAALADKVPEWQGTQTAA